MAREEGAVVPTGGFTMIILVPLLRCLEEVSYYDFFRYKLIFLADCPHMQSPPLFGTRAPEIPLLTHPLPPSGKALEPPS